MAKSRTNAALAQHRDENDDDSQHAGAAATGAVACTVPGIIPDLGVLPEGAIVMEEALERLFSRSGMSVKRAVERGELPPPTRLFGKNAWTAGVIVRHIEKRLADAAKEHERDGRRIQQLRP